MASPARAREALQHFHLPSNIRTYEFLNYYNLSYPLPPSGEVVVFPELAPSDAETGYDLQIGVQAGPASAKRRPLTITLVLDTSGSMSGLAIDRERMVVRAIAANLAAGDIVNAVEWSSSQNALLGGYVVSGPNDPTIVALANSLQAKGGTDLHGGLTTGYALATKHYGKERLNRLVLISDGGANMGVTSAELIAKHSEDADKEGIYLVGVGTGSSHAGYNDGLMDAVTDEGRGAYVYIDSEVEAQRMFGERFNEVMEVAARAVQIELTLPWYFQMHRFHGEEYSTDPKEVKPQHLAPADAMVLFQTLKPCSQEVVNDQDSISITANWQDPKSYAKRQYTVTKTIAQLLSATPMQLAKGRAIVAYAESLKSVNIDKVDDALAKVQTADPNGTDPDLVAIKELLTKHPAK